MELTNDDLWAIRYAVECYMIANGGGPRWQEISNKIKILIRLSARDIEIPSPTFRGDLR